MAPAPSSRILLAEDDPELRESIGAVLDLVGWQVVEADSLDTAVRALDAQRVDLVLTDLFGSTISEAVASVAPLARLAAPTPVAVMTAWSLKPDQLGLDGLRFVLQKPFNVDRLVTEVAAAVESARPQPDDPSVQSAYAYFRALSRCDWELLGALVTDDVQYELPGTTRFAQRISGRERFLAFSRETFAAFPKASFDEVRVYALPQGLAARYQAHWPGPGGGEVVQSGAVIFRFEGARIAQVGVRLDDERLARAMGGAA